MNTNQINHDQRARQVAYELNLDMPKNVQDEIHSEYLRYATALGSKTQKSILLIGGAGYIGTVLTSSLLAAGYRVLCLDNAIYGHIDCITPYLINPNYEFINADLCDESAVRNALEISSDVVLLAGLVGDPITRKYPELAESVNTSGVKRLFTLFDDYSLNKVVFVSTCSNYGLAADDELITEEHELSPLSSYAESKVSIESELMSRKGDARYHATILRFATAFGLSPRMRFDLTVNEFTRDIFLEKELLVFDADTWRPYCHVNDFARLIRCVLELPVETVNFEIFNAGSNDNNCTKQTIVDMITPFVPDANVRYQDKGQDRRNYRVDFQKLNDRLHYTPRYSVEYGVSELVRVLEQGVFSNRDNRIDRYGNYEILIEAK